MTLPSLRRLLDEELLDEEMLVLEDEEDMVVSDDEEDTMGLNSEEDTMAPDSEEDEEVPDSEEDTEAPDDKEDEVVPDSEEDTEAPDSEEDEVIPDCEKGIVAPDSEDRLTAIFTPPVGTGAPLVTAPPSANRPPLVTGPEPRLISGALVEPKTNLKPPELLWAGAFTTALVLGVRLTLTLLPLSRPTPGPEEDLNEDTVVRELVEDPSRTAPQEAHALASGLLLDQHSSQLQVPAGFPGNDRGFPVPASSWVSPCKKI